MMPTQSRKNPDPWEGVYGAEPMDGYVLLLGVGYNKNTELHPADVRAEYPGKHNTMQDSATWWILPCDGLKKTENRWAASVPMRITLRTEVTFFAS